VGKSPIGWPGGKFFLAGKIIAHFPEHTRYVEPFGGAMHVLYKKEPVPFEVYNDLDGNLVNFFRAVQSQPNALCDTLDMSLFSQEWFDDSRANLATGSVIERAARFYMVNQQSFACKMGSWTPTANIDRYYKFQERLTAAHARLKGVFIEHKDFRWVIDKYDSPDTLFYCDPPYMFNGVRGSGKLYKNEMTDGDHAELVAILKGIKGRFVLSGYANALYDCFNRVSLGDVPMHIHGGTGVKEKKRKEEFIWMNF
jgi:DNA adenine methylase